MNKEILLVVESVSNEKGIDKEIIFLAIEHALGAATAKRYGAEGEVDVRVSIDRTNGDYESFRRWLVVADEEENEFPAKQIPLSKAKALNSDLEVGDSVEEAVESIAFGRVAAHMAKQIIMREIKKAERDDLMVKYNRLLGTLVHGVVKKVTRDQIILGMREGVEGVITREGMLPKESLRINDRVRGVLVAVRDDVRGPMLVISRAAPGMLVELFKIEVPEIKEEVISIKAVARDPGFRAKIAVKTNDGRIDPIGACIGIRGSRVQNVSSELGGEKIDVILWDSDPAQLVVNAMAPAEIASLVIDEANHIMEITVRDDQLALAIGRGGQNVKLASELTNWRLSVVSESQAEAKNSRDNSSRGNVFVESLGVDQELADILVQEGLHSLEDVAYAPLENLAAIEGFDSELAEAIKSRARDVLLRAVLSTGEAIGTAEPAKDLLDLEGMSRHIAYLLASKGIITRADLADQAVDDLEDIEGLDAETAAKLIMSARKSWSSEGA